MRIGIDIDGVLFPWTECANEVVADYFGLEPLGEHTSWEWLKETITPEQWRWLWSEEGQMLVFRQHGRVYPGVVKAFTALLRTPKVQVHFVTHRDPRFTALHTAAFLTRHFGAHPWFGLHILTDGTPKHSLAEWDAFVDDKPETVYSLVENTSAHVFAPVRPWNRELNSLRRDIGFTYYEDPAEVTEWVLAHV